MSANQQSRALEVLRAAELRVGVKSVGGQFRTFESSECSSGSLTDLLPGNALRPGEVLVVSGSMSLLFSLAALAPNDSWIVLVGAPDAGLLSAMKSGLSAERLAVVPEPGPDAPAVIAALLDGIDVLVIGPEAKLLASDQRRLAARARERGAILFTTQQWAGAHLKLEVIDGNWFGANRGSGWLQVHRLSVRRTGRGEAARPRTFRIELPATSQLDMVAEPAQLLETAA